MPIRNPFARRPAEENLRPPTVIEPPLKTPPGFERVDTVGSKASSALSISSRRSQDTGEYKMSVVNDSGIYLPPSPTEEKGTWPRKYFSARNSTDTRSDVGEIEHFSISRESFDSYRRSFDVSARSPVMNSDAHPTRQSLDSVRFPRLPRSAIGSQRAFFQQPPTAEAEEGFEEVGLNDEAMKQEEDSSQQPPAQQPKKRGFFAKFADNTTSQDSAGSPTTSRFHIPGRKRAQSNQGAELGKMERPKSMVADQQEMQAY